MSSTISLPLDIVTDILRCLPVKSLLRFRCASQAWRSLIDRFMKDNNLPIILMGKKGSEDDSFIESIDIYAVDDDEDNGLIQIKQTSLPWNHHTRILGSCNGMLALGVYGHPKPLKVWNPLTEKCYTLPAQSAIADWLPSRDISWSCFYHDASSSSHKLLAEVPNRNPHLDDCQLKHYNLETDHSTTD
ncbi:hypothetical protein Tsubulata_037404, partial [Turnera subulata]